MAENGIEINMDEPKEYYQEMQHSSSPAFRVNGIYETLLGRQDLNYCSPSKAKHIRQRDRNENDVDLYKIYHTRNLQYLQDIKQQQIDLKQQQIEAEVQHQHLLQRIKQQAEKKRKTIRNRSKSFSALTTFTETQLDQNIINEAKTEEKSMSDIDDTFDTFDVNSEIQSKPKWALTEEQNEIVMDQEVDELLNFVDSLEIDDYLQDLEMQQKLTSIKDRIDDLQKKQKHLETQKSKIQRDEEINDNIPKSKDVTNTENKENIQKACNMKIADSKSTKSVAFAKSSKSELAESILKESENLKNVHSKQSIVSILDTQKTVQQTKTFQRKTSECIATKANQHNEPRMSTIRDRLPPLRERQNLNGNDINNLPYLYRHPGV